MPDPEAGRLRDQLEAARADARRFADQAAADFARLRAELDQARASAQAAWDQAASRPPVHRGPRVADQRGALLTDTRSGARPLIPS
jgi:hypothetical protein